MSSIRESLLQAVQLPREVVSVPELGIVVTVQGMSGTQRDAFESTLFTSTANGRRRVLDTRNIRSKLLVHCLVDEETGQPLFTENDIHDLGRVQAKILDRLFPVAQRLSGLTDQDVEDLAKNSQTAAASSALPTT